MYLQTQEIIIGEILCFAQLNYAKSGCMINYEQWTIGNLPVDI